MFHDNNNKPVQGDNIARQFRLGLMLAEARNSQGLTIDDIANRLKIKPRYVTALERGELEAVPGVVFFKGYAKGYGKLMDIPADVLEENLSGLQTERPLNLEQVKRTQDQASIPLDFKPMVRPALLIIAVLMILIGLFLDDGANALVEVDPNGMPATASGQMILDAEVSDAISPYLESGNNTDGNLSISRE